MGAGGFGQGEDVRDPGTDGAGLDQAQRFVELGLRRRVGAEDLELFDDDEAGIQIRRAGLEVADDDEPATGGQGLERLGEGEAAHDLQGDVHSLAAGDAADLLEKSRSGLTITSWAPASKSTSALPALEVTAITRPPSWRASCTACMPTPPLAPVMRTVSPAMSRPRVRRQ